LASASRADIGLGVLDEPGDGVGSRVRHVPDPGRGRRVGDRHIGDTGLSALAIEQLGVAATRGQSDHLEAVRIGGDHVERLGTDRTGATQHQYAQPPADGTHLSIVPRRCRRQRVRARWSANVTQT
jgi:hypothetical protein